MTEQPSDKPHLPTWQLFDSERTASELRCARAAIASERYEEALTLLGALQQSTDRTIAFRACLYTARARHSSGERSSARALFDTLGERKFRCAELAPTLVLELARTLSGIGEQSASKKVYGVLIERLEGTGDRRDAQGDGAQALAHYRLGQLYMDDGDIDRAYFHWREAYEARRVDDVFPYASYALASRIGSRRMPPERIEFMYLHAARSNRIALASRARLELADFLAQHGQYESARGHVEIVAAQASGPYAKEAVKRLELLAVEASSAPALRALHDAVELRRTASALIVDSTARRGVIIVGAGTGGRYLLDALKTRHDRPRICGFVDDDTSKITPDRLPMLGAIDQLRAAIKREGASEVLMAIPTAPGNKRLDVVRACREADVPLRNLPSMHELIMGWDMRRPTLVNQLRPVKIEETIGSEVVRIDEGVVEWARGLRALVIGAGDLGAEICRRLALGTVESLVVIDDDEDALALLTAELSNRRGLHHVVPILGDWTDESLLAREFETQRPLVVIHAKPLRSDLLVARNPYPSVYRDVMGARSLAKAAAIAKVPYTLYVSDTRAADHSSIFGASKALSEQAVLSCEETHPDTAYAVVRTTPPMGTKGSIIARISQQIESGGPVSVPVPSTVRLLSVARTAELVLHVARLMSEQYLRGLFAIDSGEEHDLQELAREMIRLGGREPDVDIEVKGDRHMVDETPIDLRGEPVVGQREILRLHRKQYSNVAVDGLLERLEELPHDVDETRTLAVATIEFARAIPNVEDPSAARV